MKQAEAISRKADGSGCADFHNDWKGKGGDREDIKLPAVQEELLKAIYTTGKPVIWF
ncbi:MAG: hypothetical protein R2784_18580 [Saprospiraceae bacterium]